MTSSFYNGISGVKTQQFGIDTWANNIANINTVGYRANMPEFADMLTMNVNQAHFDGMNEVGMGARAQSAVMNQNQGYISTTDRDFDYAIQGRGWFSVQGTNDPTQLRYTRAGDFYTDSAGSLVTSGGDYVLGAISPNISIDATGAAIVTDTANIKTNLLDAQNNVTQIRLPKNIVYPAQPATANSAAVPAGALKGYETDGEGRIFGLFDNGKQVAVAQLALFNFQNEQGLQRIGASEFVETANSGTAFLRKDKNGHVDQSGQLLSKKLEMSNVSAATALTELIVMQKAFDASAKSITTSDQMIQKAINLKGR